MKALLILLLTLSLSATALPESIDVFDPDGGYRNFDVTRKDRDHFNIYDYERGAYLDAEIKRHGKEVEVFDYSEGTYKTYDLNHNFGGGLEVYDYESGKYFDVDRSDVEKLMEDEKKGRFGRHDRDSGCEFHGEQHHGIFGGLR